MSLDITIISPEPIKKKSTGIYARIDGQTRELTPEECLAHFPDAFSDLNDVPIQETVSDEFWSGNITHNLTEMADDCVPRCDDITLYNLLWRDIQEPYIGDEVWAYISKLSECLYILKRDPEHFKKFNPPNSWGNYEQLCQFTEDFIKALISMPEGSHIEYSR